MNSKFYTIAKQEFKFLEDEFDFRCIQSEEDLISYANEKVKIVLAYDKYRSFEIECSFKQPYKSEQDFYYTLRELLLYKNANERNLLNTIQVSDEEKLEHVIHAISKALQKYGEEVLEGSENIFLALEKFRNEESKKYTDEVELSSIKVIAERAWNEKKYTEYYKLLNPYKDRLKNSDKKKLEFSLKKINMYD